MAKAYQKPLLPNGFTAGASLASSQFLAGKFNSSGNIVVCGAGEAAIGIIQNNPASGLPVTVEQAGISKAILGGTVSAGDDLTSDSAGKLVCANKVNGGFIVARALTSGVANDTIPVLVQCNPDPLRFVPLVGAADLTLKAGFAVKLDANEKVALAGDGELAIGILMVGGNADGQTCYVAMGGLVNAISGAAIGTAGSRVASDANGKLIIAAATKNVVGVVLEEAGGADENIRVLVVPGPKQT